VMAAAITTANAGALSATSAHSGRSAFNDDFLPRVHESAPGPDA
jgi:hypothetical protein